MFLGGPPHASEKNINALCNNVVKTVIRIYRYGTGKAQPAAGAEIFKLFKLFFTRYAISIIRKTPN